MLYVLGNVTEDLLFRVPRLPAEGETLIAAERLCNTGGKGLNQAVVAARAGAEVTLVAPVGRDAATARARRALHGEPLSYVLLETAQSADQSIILVAAGGENVIVSNAAAASALEPQAALEALQAIGPADTLLVQGNLTRATTVAALSHARACGAATVVNPSPIRWPYDGVWPLVTTAVFNRTELSELSGYPEPESGAAALFGRGVAEIVVTMGAQGAWAGTVDAHTRIDAAATEVRDTAGAGDTFCGVYLAARLRGAGIAGAARTAARAAAITVSRPGTSDAFPSRAEMRRLMAEDDP